jgi:hypothetical protein
VLNNVHRYILYASIVVVGVFVVRHHPHVLPRWVVRGEGGVPDLGWSNVVLISAYTFSCHSLRHLIGGNKDCYTCLGEASQAQAL